MYSIESLLKRSDLLELGLSKSHIAELQEMGNSLITELMLEKFATVEAMFRDIGPGSIRWLVTCANEETSVLACLACSTRNDLLRAALDYVPEGFDINFLDKDGISAIRWATATGMLENVQAFIEHGALRMLAREEKNNIIEGLNEIIARFKDPRYKLKEVNIHNRSLDDYKAILALVSDPSASAGSTASGTKRSRAAIDVVVAEPAAAGPGVEESDSAAKPPLAKRPTRRELLPFGTLTERVRNGPPRSEDDKGVLALGF